MEQSFIISFITSFQRSSIVLIWKVMIDGSAKLRGTKRTEDLYEKGE